MYKTATLFIVVGLLLILSSTTVFAQGNVTRGMLWGLNWANTSSIDVTGHSQWYDEGFAPSDEPTGAHGFVGPGLNRLITYRIHDNYMLTENGGIAGAATLCGWMNVNGSSPSIGAGNLLRYYEADNTGGSGVIESYDGAPDDYLIADSNGNTVFVDTGSLIFDSWHHYCFTYNVTDLSHFYVDGVAVNDISWASFSNGISNAEIDANGGAGTDVAVWHDEVYAYNRSLSDEEIMMLYSYGLNGTTYPFVASTNSSNTSNSTSAPVVTLLTPANNTFASIPGNTTFFNFQWSVTDVDSLAVNCTLFVNTIATNTTSTTGTKSINRFLTNGTYNWRVACTDGTNSTSSGTQFFSITTATSGGSSSLDTFVTTWMRLSIQILLIALFFALIFAGVNSLIPIPIKSITGALMIGTVLIIVITGLGIGITAFITFVGG